MGLYGAEAGYYYTAHVNFTTVFPILIALLTIVCLMVAPIFLEGGKERTNIVMDLNDGEDEDQEEEPSFELLMKQKHIKHIPDILPAKIKKMQWKFKLRGRSLIICVKLSLKLNFIK